MKTLLVTSLFMAAMNFGDLTSEIPVGRILFDEELDGLIGSNIFLDSSSFFRLEASV